MKIHASIVSILALGAMLFLSACSPKPDTSIVVYNQPKPELTAQAHVKERAGLIYKVLLNTGSMEPMLTGGDAVVYDTTFPFENLKPGMLVLYIPTEAQRAYYPGLLPGVPVTHLVAAWSGNEIILDGIANKHYERGVLRMRRDTYIGKAVNAYTPRGKAP